MIRNKNQIDNLEAGDIITRSHPLQGEIQRYCVTWVDHAIIRVIILLDKVNKSWTGTQMHFAKCELRDSNWQRYVK